MEFAGLGKLLGMDGEDIVREGFYLRRVEELLFGVFKLSGFFNLTINGAEMTEVGERRRM